MSTFQEQKDSELHMTRELHEIPGVGTWGTASQHLSLWKMVKGPIRTSPKLVTLASGPLCCLQAFLARPALSRLSTVALLISQQFCKAGVLQKWPQRQVLSIKSLRCLSFHHKLRPRMSKAWPSVRWSVFMFKKMLTVSRLPALHISGDLPHFLLSSNQAEPCGPKTARPAGLRCADPYALSHATEQHGLQMELASTNLLVPWEHPKTLCFEATSLLWLSFCYDGH